MSNIDIESKLDSIKLKEFYKLNAEHSYRMKVTPNLFF